MTHITHDLPSDESIVPTFDHLGLHPLILKALTKSGYATPTPIQEQAIPHALNGRDLLLSAQTGSGKTASFVLPILDKLAKTAKIKPQTINDFSQKSHRKHQKVATRALILTPTRELALQVQDNVRKYSSCMKGIFSVPLVGGAPYGGQIRALSKGVQIIIATPGRLIDHINDGRVDLSELDVLVLDEADRMLDMGFAEAIQTILAHVPTTRQTLMSSATWDGQVGKIAESLTNNPERIAIKVQSAHIDESVYFCDDFNHKNKLLSALLSDEEVGQAIIFTATKRSTEQLAQTLNEQGLSARYLHGDLPQSKRNRIITDVKTGKCDFLIATDVAARGIDIASISHVVNYDLPRQVEDYVHRIGRCGRAGRTGVAMNLCSRDDRRQLSHINRYLGRDMKECVITGLEPKFVPKKDDKRKNPRKTFDKNERFDKRRTQPSGDVYQAGKRGFGKSATDKCTADGCAADRFATANGSAWRAGATGHKKSARFGKRDTSFVERSYDPKSGLYGKRSRQMGDGKDSQAGVANSKYTKSARIDGVGKLGKPSVRAFYGKKPKPIEEVFFNRRQAKQSRRFGDL